MKEYILQPAALRKKLLSLFTLITVMLSGSFQAHGVGYHERFMFIDENGSLWEWVGMEIMNRDWGMLELKPLLRKY